MDKQGESRKLPVKVLSLVYHYLRSNYGLVAWLHWEAFRALGKTFRIEVESSGDNETVPNLQVHKLDGPLEKMPSQTWHGNGLGSSSRNWLASETCPIRTSQEKHSELTPCYLVARRLWFRVKSLDCIVLTNIRDCKFVYKSNVRVSLTYLIMDDPKYIERIREDNIDAALK